MSNPRRQNAALTAFAERMQTARKRVGLTQGEVAQRLGLTQATVSRLEIDGERSAYVADFARLYGVDCYWLHSGEGLMLTGQARRFSVEAEDLARMLDSIADPEVKRRVYSLSQLVAELGCLPAYAAPAYDPMLKAVADTRGSRLSQAKGDRVSKAADAPSSPEPTGRQTARRKTHA